ncbi:MAG: nucleotidyltransferase domain-containing protein, partial [Bacteroidales bacterium]|nr:nucleotidyltransferase domain-containing protein [Bacteroidales bacterium]
MFTDNETLETSSLENGNEQVYTIPTYSFSRLVFSKTYNEAGIIRNSVDVAAFVSSHRLGDRKKLSYMVLAHSNEIQANVHTHYSKLTPPDYAQLAKRMADDIITYGGTAVITYGSCELKPTEVQRLQKHLKVALLSTGGHSVLVDHVNIKASLNVDLMNSGEMAEKTYSYISAADEGWLREPGERYAISSSAEHEEIQGIALSRQEIKDLVQEHVEALLAEADTNVGIAALEIHGSRGRGTAKPESDLDVVIEYHGDMKEDGMFNILNEEPLHIDGVRVDINPIRPEETGTLEQYMERSREVNSIATVFGRRQAANLTLNEDIIYRSKRITLNQSSLLERPNCAPYPTDQGLSNNKGTHILKEKQATPEHLRFMREDLRFRSSKNIKKAPMGNSTGAPSNEPVLRTNHQDTITTFDSSNEAGLRTNHQDPVTPFDSTAKIRKNLDILTYDCEENKVQPRNFIGAISSVLELHNNGNHSNYGTFRAKNGVEFRLRISDHNAASKNFDDAGYKDGLSIVVSRKPNKGIDNNGNAHITEYYYNAYNFQKPKGGRWRR